MAVQAKAIKQKIKSVSNIKKIAKTMEMVSVAKMKKSIARALGVREYARYALELIDTLTSHEEQNNIFLKDGSGAEELVVIIAGNKGLCGGYHVNLFKTLAGYTKKQNHKISCITVGKYAEKMCLKLGLPIQASFINFSEHATVNETRNLSDIILSEFQNGKYKNVSIVYTRFVKSVSYTPIVRKLLPIRHRAFEHLIEETIDTLDKSKNKHKALDTEYIFEPSPQDVLSLVLPKLIEIAIYETLSESFASEHSARMFAMKNAGDNAEDLLSNLSRSYNNARQESITNELSEIIGGANALAVN